MVASTKVLSLLALAASTLAAPAPHGRGHKKIVWHTVIETAYVTVPYGYTPPKTSSSSSKPEPVVSTIYYTPAPPAPTSSSSSVYVAPPPPSSTKATPTPTPTPSDPPATGYMGVVDEWRQKLGLAKLAYSSKLEANALNTAQESPGEGQMKHKLNPGSMGQVLAPGSADEFYHCFVGGWLCERPDMPGMDGVCATASKGWYYTSTGHADLLISQDYKTIGCANAMGVWACDLGYE